MQIVGRQRYLIQILQALSPRGHSPVISLMIAKGITNMATFKINFLSLQCRNVFEIFFKRYSKYIYHISTRDEERKLLINEKFPIKMIKQYVDVDFQKKKEYFNLEIWIADYYFNIYFLPSSPIGYKDNYQKSRVHCFRFPLAVEDFYRFF